MRALKDTNTEERLKKIGDIIIDAILDDDPSSNFTEYIEDPNQIFKSNHKLPEILQNSPPILSVCCFFGSEKCFRTLIDLGSDPNEMDKLNYTAAHFVAFSGNLEIARDLFNLGVDFQQPTNRLFQYMPFIPPNQEFYPQEIAAMNLKQEFINWLWLKGCKIEKTLLIYSAAYGNMETVNFLFDTLHFFNDDDLNAADEDIISKAINSAAVNGQDQVISFLIKKFPQIDLVESLILAARNGSIECVKICCDQQKKNGYVDAWDAFLNACSFGHLDIVLFFMKSGVKPSSSAFKRKLLTPLECAVNNNHFNVAESLIQNGYVKITDENFLQTKTSSKNENSNDKTLNSSILLLLDEDPIYLLEQATANSNLNMIKLIKNTFNIDLSSLCNIANIALRNKNFEITDYFIDNGVSIKDVAYINFFLRRKKSKRTIMQDEPFCEYFIKKGILESEELPLNLILSGDLQGLLNALDKGGEISESFLNKNINQIINENLECRNYDMIEFLLDNYNLKVKDSMLFGLEISDQQTYFNIIKKFIEKGVSLSSPKNGHSLLYYAIINNNLKAIELLKNNGADFTHVAIKINSFQNSNFFDVLKDIIESDNDFSKCEPKGSGKNFFLTQIYYYLQNKDLLKFLFKIGFIKDINKQLDDDGNTLLDFALLNEDVDTMIFLLSKNASIEDCNNDPHSFEDFAKSANNKQLSDLIDKQIESYYSLEDD